MSTDKTPASYIPLLIDGLTQFGNETGAAINEYQGQPATNSQARTEYGTYVEPRAIEDAWGIATILIEFAANHLHGFVSLIDQPMHIEASWTCVRSMLEACSIGAWVTDPTIDPHTRAARTYAHRYEGLMQQIKFGRAAGVEQSTVDRVNAQIDAIEQQAIAAGFQPLRNGTKRTGIGQHTLGATDIIGVMLDEGVTYRLLSAIAHGHHWAILAFYKLIPGYGPTDSITIAMQKQVNPDMVKFLGIKAFKSFTRILWNQARFCGWDLLRLEERIEAAADAIQFPISKRFWRS